MQLPISFPLAADSRMILRPKYTWTDQTKGQVAGDGREITGGEMDTETPKMSKMLRINAKPAPVEVELGRTAVIVVDMQNAFLSQGGMFDEAAYDIAGAARRLTRTRSCFRP